MIRGQRHRPMHYTAMSLYDGTILAAYPVRKPGPRIIKRDKLDIDDDGVCWEYGGAGRQLSKTTNEGRTRFQDIIATRLNTHRAIREMVLPQLVKLQKDIDDVRNRLDDIQRLLRANSEVRV